MEKATKSLKDLSDIASELDEVAGLLEIMALYFEGAMHNPPLVDVVSGTVAVGAVRAVSEQVERISEDISIHDLFQSQQKAKH